MKLTADVKQNNLVYSNRFLDSDSKAVSASQTMFICGVLVCKSKQIRTIKTQYNLIQHLETLCESLQKDALTQSWKLFTVVQSQRRPEFDTIFTN